MLKAIILRSNCPLRATLTRTVQTFTQIADKNYYDVLGVSKSSSSKEIRDKYLELVKLHHPDSPNLIKTVEECDLITENFQLIQEAYETLSNETLRKEYDSNVQHRQTYNTGPNTYASYYGKGTATDPNFFRNRLRLGIRDETQELKDFIHREAKREYEERGLVRMQMMQETRHAEGNPMDYSYETYKRNGPFDHYRRQKINYEKLDFDNLKLRLIKLFTTYPGTCTTVLCTLTMAFVVIHHDRKNPRVNLNLGTN